MVDGTTRRRLIRTTSCIASLHFIALLSFLQQSRNIPVRSHSRLLFSIDVSASASAKENEDPILVVIRVRTYDLPHPWPREDSALDHLTTVGRLGRKQ